ncbi:MAG TPA: NifB/NifX family molybdenum-iron cluster-binding protein [Bacteroidales bacterium]|nr:NifB/NifX family molybdenum-iron cluster-binding protein [Bacteroidales bacterium]
MGKIAIPTNGELIDDHFGHCQYHTIYCVNDKNEVEDKEILPSSPGCGCRSNIAGKLSGMGADTLLAGNIGQGAVEKLTSAGLKVFPGYTGKVSEILNIYLGGDMGNEKVCKNHQHYHCGGHSQYN